MSEDQIRRLIREAILEHEVRFAGYGLLTIGIATLAYCIAGKF